MYCPTLKILGLSPGFCTLEVGRYGKQLYLIASSRDRKGRSYPAEYCLESVEEYSDGKVHKSEHEPLNGNVNTVYSLIRPGQENEHSLLARGNTRISRTEFVYDERARDCKCLLIFKLPAQNVFIKSALLLQISFYA